MDEEDPSINDILDADDDHENWSDFSIEEELPSNYREEERYNNNSRSSVGKNKQLCQEENCSTAETLEMTEILIKSLLDEVLDKVFEHSELSEYFELSEKCEISETTQLSGIPEFLGKTEICENTEKAQRSELSEKSGLSEKSDTPDELSEDLQDEIIQILPAITVAQDTCHLNFEAFEVKNDLNNNVVEDFANALASEVIHETLNEAKDMQEMEDEDELFLVLHPPQHESGTKIFQLCQNSFSTTIP